MFIQNLKSVALPNPEIRGGTPKIWAVPGYAHSPLSPKFLMGFFIRIGTVNIHAKFEVRIALPVPEIIGGTQKNWAVPGYAHAPFSRQILMGFYSDRPCKYTRQI